MNLSDTLLLVLAMQCALFGASWWLAAVLLELPRAPALHWMGFSLLGSLAALLFSPLPDLPPWVTLPLRDLALLGACMLLRRGTALFEQQPANDLEHGLLLLVLAAGLALVGTAPQAQWVQAMMVASAVGWVLLRTGLDPLLGQGREHGRLGAWVLGLPALLLGAFGLGRGALALVVLPDASYLSVAADSGANRALLVLVMLGTTLMQLSLLFRVVLRMVGRLRQLSSQDELTGLLNRRAWQQALQAESLRRRRTAQTTGLLLIDVDHFAAIGEGHGHAQSDQVLVEVARVLEATARATDLVARLGGEAFGVLLTDTDPSGAAEAAERLRQAVAGLNLQAGGQRLAVTVSVGLALQAADAADEDGALAQLQARADAALHAAKLAGRNQVHLAPMPA